MLCSLRQAQGTNCQLFLKGTENWHRATDDSICVCITVTTSTRLRYGKETYTEGLEQLAGYMDKLGCKEGWLVVFDRRIKTSWEEKLFWQTNEETAGKQIHIVGC